MQNVPKIVQARLQRAMPSAAQAHPDADLLTAFAERSLAESEREQVMEHLAHCGDCRDVVAIALPATEDVASVRSAQVRSGWLSWPVLRWGVVVAGVAVVTSIGILQYRQRHQQSETLARNETVALQTQPALGRVPQTVPTEHDGGKQQVAEKVEARTKKSSSPRASRFSAANSSFAANHLASSANALIAKPQAIPGAAVGVGAGRGIGSGSGAGLAPKTNHEPERESFEWGPRSKEAGSVSAARQNPSAANPAPNVTATSNQKVVIGASSQMVEVQSEAVEVAAAQSPTDLPAQNNPSVNLDVVKAKDSVPAQDASGAASAPAVPGPNLALQTPPSLMLRASPRWTISSTGALQRSFDAGKTWEDVSVIEDVGAKSPTASRARVAGADEYKYKDADAKKVEAAQPAPTPVFRAVAAIGTEVWAGGSSAMLFRSADSGIHWVKIQPSAGSAVLTGDVISIRFSDAQNGTVRTSNAEVWTTADAGQSWQKQ